MPAWLSQSRAEKLAQYRQSRSKPLWKVRSPRSGGLPVLLPSPGGRGAGRGGSAADPTSPNPLPSRERGLKTKPARSCWRASSPSAAPAGKPNSSPNSQTKAKPRPKTGKRKPRTRVARHQRFAGIAAGWVWASAEQLCEFITKGTTPPKDIDDGSSPDVPFLRVTNLTSKGVLDFSDQVFVSIQLHRVFFDTLNSAPWRCAYEHRRATLVKFQYP